MAEPLPTARRTIGVPVWVLLVSVVAAGLAGVLVGGMVRKQPLSVRAVLGGSSKDDVQRYYTDPDARRRLSQALIGKTVREMVELIGPAEGGNVPVGQFLIWYYESPNRPPGKTHLLIYTDAGIVVGIDSPNGSAP